MPKHILLIEDDLEFAELIVDFLKTKDIKVTTKSNPYDTLSLDLKEYNLCLLDLGLPGIDGLEICEEFRKKSNIPIIISSARGSVSDKVIGLKKGADDYLPKPYDPDELHARIISTLRRSEDMKDENPISNFTIDEKIMDIFFKENALKLTNAEFEVLKKLINQNGEVLSKEQILEDSVCIEAKDGKSLAMIISKIRQKIRSYSSSKHVVAIRGKGYRFAC